MKKNIFTVIEITDTHLKLLQARMVKGERLATRCEIKAFAKFTDEEMVEMITELASSKSVPAESLIVAIPRRQALVHQLTLPSHEDAEIRKMIGFQIIQKAPYSKEDLIIDYIPLEKSADGYTKALIVAVHNDVAFRYVRIFREAGINPNIFTVSSLGLVSWYYTQVPHSSANERETVAVLNIDLNHAELCFLRLKKLLYARHLNYGARDLEQEQIPGFLKQLELTFSSYHKESMGPEVSKVVVATPLKEKVKGLTEPLRERLKVPIEVQSPLEHLQKERSFQVPKGVDEERISIAVGLGLLAVEGKSDINLLPQEVHDSARSQMRKREWTKSSILVVITCLLGFFIFQVDHMKESQYLEILNEKIDLTQPRVKEAEQKMKALRFLLEEFQGRILVVDIMEEFYKLIPEEMTLNSLSLSEKDHLIIQGQAQTLTLVNAFQDKLVRSPLFNEVTPQYATKKKRFREEYIEFKITCRINLKKGAAITL